MRKFGVIFALLLVLVSSVWLYLANQFKRTVTREIQNNNFINLSNPESVVIEKFKFKVTLKDVTIPILKGGNVTADIMSVFCNPLTNNITVYFNGDKLNIGKGESAMYVPSPNITIVFNKSFTNNSKINFTNIDMMLTSQDLSLYFAKDNTFIYKASLLETNFSTKLKNNAYHITYDSNIEEGETNFEPGYLQKIAKNVLPEHLVQKLDNQFFDKHYYAILQKAGPTSSSNNLSVSLSKNLVKTIIRYIEEAKDLDEIYKEFDYKKENYSIALNSNCTNAVFTESIDVLLSGDGENILMSINTKGLDNYSNNSENNNETSLKKSINTVLSDLLLEEAQKYADLYDVNLTATPEDFIPLVESLNFNHSKINLKYNHNIESADSLLDFDIGLNDFNIKSQGSFKDKIYNGKIEIKTPALLIDNISNIYTKSVKPILDQNITQENAPKFEYIDSIMENIKNNGFNAVSVFHHKPGLQVNETFVSNIIFNPKKFELKINDKTILDILTDKNIIKFLQDMPEKDDSKENKDNKEHEVN